jgi:alkanesulfonate monooxygenase SsuD/methylene tetrahydromethanopterin reductase-like flavin-dependent oxidoreductase (luciferase family)
MTAVTCPIMRYHPAIVAQAAAALELLSNDRFPDTALRRCDNHG